MVAPDIGRFGNELSAKSFHGGGASWYIFALLSPMTFSGLEKPWQ